MPNIEDILKETTQKFLQAGIESAELNAKILLCKALNCKSIDLFINKNKSLLSSEIDEFNKLVAKRLKRIPLQYLEEKVQFYDLELFITNEVLIPRQETEELVDFTLSKIKNKQNKTILDIGTGSGCIALAIAKNLPNSQVTGIDKSKESISVANKNKNLLHIENVQFVAESLENYLPKTKFDVIISNPPYVPLVNYMQLEPEIFFEPKDAITDGEDGLYFYKLIEKKLPLLLNNKGSIFLEIETTLKDEIQKIFTNVAKPNIIKDIYGLERILFLEEINF